LRFRDEFSVGGEIIGYFLHFLIMGATLQRKEFEPAIQGLRGLSALSVIITHLRGMPDLAGFLPELPNWIGAALTTGGHGVELFFIISGYLIPASLIRHKLISKFLYDRCLRILPVFAVLHFLLFIIGPLVGYKFFKGIDLFTYIKLFFVNLFFLPWALGLPAGQQNAWTLSFEWMFYIGTASLYFFAFQRKNWVAAATVAIVLIGLVWSFPIAAYFVVGALFSVHKFQLRLSGGLGVLVGLICLGSMYALLQNGDILLSIIPAFLLFAMVLTPASGMAKFLESRMWQFLGKISYSLYLVHPFVLFPLQMFGQTLARQGVDKWWAWAVFIVIGLSASIAVASLSHDMLEVRLRRSVDALLTGLAKRKIGSEQRLVSPEIL